MACPLCGNLGTEETRGQTFGPNQRIIKFFTPAQLGSSAATCAECKLLYDALTAPVPPGSLLADKLNRYDPANPTHDGLVEVKIAPGQTVKMAWRNGGVSLELYTREKDGTVHENLGPAKEVAHSSGDDECVDLIRKWMDLCEREHPLCDTGKGHPLPTRVIDVGGDVGGAPPRLVVSNGTKGRYAALSYCWGDPKIHGEPFKTTNANFDKHLRELPLAQLPSTLKDAIVLCRRLGLQYIWIDAICIIQGDKADWARESSKMCDCYSNAAVTIAADFGDGNSAGLFHAQSFGTAPIEVFYKGRPVCVRPDLQKLLHNDITLLQRLRSATEEPIHRRAWTFQEALLSHRMIHFTAGEVLWECNTVRDCECRRFKPVELDEYSTRVFRTPELFRRMGDEQTAFLQWREIAQTFTEREIGFDGDRLAALAGMARQFSNMMGKVFGEAGGSKAVTATAGTGNHQGGLSGAREYLAGLWRDDLGNELLWTMFDDHWRLNSVKERRPKEWRAPSWSWASMEGPINLFPMSNFQSLVEILECTTTLEDGDPFGRVSRGRLVARGKVAHGMTVRVVPARDHDAAMGRVHGVRYALQNEDGSLTLDEMYAATSFVPDLDTETPEGTAGLSILRMGQAGATSFSTRHYVPFLLLRPTSRAAGEFERVGISFRGGAWETVAVDVFQSAKEEVVAIV